MYVSNGGSPINIFTPDGATPRGYTQDVETNKE